MADWKQIEGLVRDAGLLQVMGCDRVMDESEPVQRMVKLAGALHAAAMKNKALTPFLVGQEGVFMELKGMTAQLLNETRQD